MNKTEEIRKMAVKKQVLAKVFKAIENVNIEELSKCTEAEIRPVLPCLVRMSLISPLDTSKNCAKQRIDILTLISGIEWVNSIVALLSIDFHILEADVKKEQQMRQKISGGGNQNDSVLIGSLANGLSMEYERSDMTRRLRLVLSELLFIQSQVDTSPGGESTSGEHDFFIKQSDLFDNEIYVEEISDIICIALAELPTILSINAIVETLLFVHNGPMIICRIVANFPDCFREVCTNLISRGEKQEENLSSTIRALTISMLCRMNPSQALAVRSKCVELCRMPALAVSLTLSHQQDHSAHDSSSDMVAFISGLLLGNDQSVRNWFALFVRAGQKRSREVSSNALQQLREELLRRLQTLIDCCSRANNLLADDLVVRASALLRLYCALRGIAAIKFQDDEVQLLVQLLTSHPNPTPAGVRFVSIGLCMLIACPSLIGLGELERRSIEWVQWLVREEAYFESASGVSASFGEMLLLMAIHFHSNQLSAICDLVCSTLGMKIPIRHNNMTRMKQVFTQEIFTEQIVTTHAVKVPVTDGLSAGQSGFLPVHCIHQLLKSRAFAKHNVNIKQWIYKQICVCTHPLHPVLPQLIEVYVNSIILPSQGRTLGGGNVMEFNKPLSEDEIREVFRKSQFGAYLNLKGHSLTLKGHLLALKGQTKDANDVEELKVSQNTLAPQLLMLYYLLLYEDHRLNHAQTLISSSGGNTRKITTYSVEFFSELPIKYLMQNAQKDQSSYATLFGPLLKLLATHFPHLTLVDDWVDDVASATKVSIARRPATAAVAAAAAMATMYDKNEDNDDRKRKRKRVSVTEAQLNEAFVDLEKNPCKLAAVFETLLAIEAIDCWPFAETVTRHSKRMLENWIPRYLQDLYKDVWFKLNSVLPRKLWVMTVKNLVGNYTGLTRIDVAEDPLQIMRCDERVFRCAPLFSIVLRVLRASLASSRSQLTQHLQSNPKLDVNGQVVNVTERDEMCRALVAAQDSAAVQMLLEACLETEEDRKQSSSRKWALQEVRSLVCSHLHQVFIADTTLAKLVHFQGYPAELIEVIVKGVPSMHICLDFLQELMQQPSLSKQVFAIQLLSHLSVQYSLPKSCYLSIMALNLLHALLGSISSNERIKLFEPIMDSLVRISRAFPPMADEIVQLLMQLGRICESQASLCSRVDVHLSNCDDWTPDQSARLRDLTHRTYLRILEASVLNRHVYNN